MVRLPLDRGERCAHNSVCEDGKGRAQGTHEAVSKPTWNSFHFNDQLHAYVVCSVVDETPELIFTNCVKRRPHIVDWLCFARWGSRVIGAAHLMGISRTQGLSYSFEFSVD